MQVIFFGTPQFAVPSLERLLLRPEFEVLAVVTQPDKRRGRGQRTIPSAVKKVALEHQLPVWQPQRIKKDAETLAKLKQASADAFVVVAYGQILSPEILAMPKLGCINVHGSILPKYRGAAPIQWSLYHGETETGVTTMLMDEGMDTGAMLLKAYTPVGLLDSAHQVAARLASGGGRFISRNSSKTGTSRDSANSSRLFPGELRPLNSKVGLCSRLVGYCDRAAQSSEGIFSQLRGIIRGKSPENPRYCSLRRGLLVPASPTTAKT